MVKSRMMRADGACVTLMGRLSLEYVVFKFFASCFKYSFFNESFQVFLGRDWFSA